MLTRHCKRCDRDWPQNAEITFGPRDEFGICRFPCCRAACSEGPYNGSLGSKGGGASFDAAEQMKTKAGRLRVQCLDMIREHGPLGADRLAFLMDADEDNVSPRLSELVALGMLVKGPRTARTKRGNPAHVYALSDAGEVAA